MKLSKRQWVMFTLFIIVFAHTLFSAAILQNMSVIVSNLSLLLFLAALYMDKNSNSRFVLLISGLWIIVSAIMDYLRILPYMFDPFQLTSFFSLVVSTLKFFAIYFFIMSFYNNTFRNFKKNMTITLLLVPSLIMVGYTLYTYLNLPVELFSGFELLSLYINLIVSFILPIAMFLYTWMRYSRIS